MTSPILPKYAMNPLQEGIEMGAKAIFHQGKWRVQVNLEGKSRIITRLRDFVRNKDYPEQQVAEIVAEIVNTQVLVGNFQWDAWFPQDKRQYKFKLLAARWLDEKRKPSSQYQYSLVMRKNILPVLGDEDVRYLHRLNFHWIRQDHGDTPKAQNIRSICQNFMNWCYREEIRTHPITLPKVSVTRRGLPYIDREARNRVQAAVSPEYQGATMLSLRMGLRAGEIAALQWSDIEDTGITVRHNLSYYKLTSPKEGGSRFCPFQGEVAEMLRNHHKTYIQRNILASGYVFRLDSGARMWPNLISWAWSTAAKRIGIQAKLHWNRHSLGQDMLEEGFSIGQVQAILGHRSVRTTESSYARHNRGALVNIATARQKHNEA